MTGADLKDWRRRNGFTQEELRIALGVTRQTIVSWEQSENSISRLVELALRALEHLPQYSLQVAGKRHTAAKQLFERGRGREIEKS